MVQTTSNYERVGGGSAVSSVVQRFYEKVLDDELLTPYFEGVDMTLQRRHLALLVAQLLDGPAEYAGRPLDEAHRGLHITDEAYDHVVAHLVGSLHEFSVPPDIVESLGEVLAEVRGLIVDDGVGAIR